MPLKGDFYGNGRPKGAAKKHYLVGLNALLVCQEIICRQAVTIKPRLGWPARALAIAPLIKNKDLKSLIQEQFNIFKSMGYIPCVPMTKKDRGRVPLEGKEPAVQSRFVRSLKIDLFIVHAPLRRDHGKAPFRVEDKEIFHPGVEKIETPDNGQDEYN